MKTKPKQTQNLIETVLNTTLTFHTNAHIERCKQLENWFMNNFMTIVQIITYNNGDVDLYVNSKGQIVHSTTELIICNKDGFVFLPSGGNDHPSDYDIITIENIVLQIVKANEFNRKAVINRDNVVNEVLYEEEI